MTTNEFNPGQAIGYYRVSTQRQEEEGHGPERYLERLESVGINPVDIYFDAESGGKYEREDLQKALARLKEPDKRFFVIPYHSRLHRDIGVWARIRDAILLNGCELIELDKGLSPRDLVSAAGNLQANLDATFAQYQRDQAREHSTKGHAFRRSQNRIVNPRFGYTKDEGQKLIVNEDLFPGGNGKTYREVAIEVIDTLIELGGYRATCREMAKRYGEHHPDRKGVAKNFPASANGLKRWIKCPTLRGYLVDFPGLPNELVREGEHEALMDPDRWRAVKATIEHISSVPNPVNDVQHQRRPLAGKIICGLCGGKHNGSSVITKGRRYSYLVCRGNLDSAIKRTCEYKNSIKEADFYKEVIRQVCDHAISVAQELSEPNTEEDPKIIKLGNEIEKLQSMEDPLLSEVIRIKQSQLSQLRQDAEETVTREDVEMYEIVAADPEFWEELEPHELRVILDTLVKRAVVKAKSLPLSRRVEVEFYR
ncbi:recombinase family protein [Leptothoe sp. ISB3NOV94-8A]